MNNFSSLQVVQTFFPTCAYKKTLEKLLSPLFRGPCTLHLCKKSEKSSEAILHKVQKTLFLGRFLPKFAQKNFNENRASSYFGHYHFASLCNKSENSNEPIPRKAGNRRTDGRTDGRTKVNLKDLRGRSKNQQLDSILSGFNVYEIKIHMEQDKSKQIPFMHLTTPSLLL